MNDYQSRVYRMFNTVVQTAEDFKNDWVNTPSYANLYNQFITNVIQQFPKALAQQAQKSTGVTASKKNVRGILNTQTLFIAESMMAFASATSDAALLKDAHLTESDVRKLSDDAIIGKATVMTTLATANLANLGPYKITNTVINNLKTNISRYSGLIGKPQQAIDKSKEGTDWIEELIREGLRLLDLMDKQMILFKTTVPDFYSQYFAARKIQAPSTRTRAISFMVLDAAGRRVEDAVIVVPALQIEKRTGPSGGCFVQNAPAGIYTGRVSKNGYVPQDIQIPVNDGEGTKVEIKLLKP